MYLAILAFSWMGFLPIVGFASPNKAPWGPRYQSNGTHLIGIGGVPPSSGSYTMNDLVLKLIVLNNITVYKAIEENF